MVMGCPASSCGGDIGLILEFIAIKVTGTATVLTAREIFEVCPQCFWPPFSLRQGNLQQPSKVALGHTVMQNEAGATGLHGGLASTSAALGSLHFQAQAGDTGGHYIPRSAFWYSLMCPCLCEAPGKCWQGLTGAT